MYVYDQIYPVEPSYNVLIADTAYVSIHSLIDINLLMFQLISVRKSSNKAAPTVTAKYYPNIRSYLRRSHSCEAEHSNLVGYVLPVLAGAFLRQSFLQLLAHQNDAVGHQLHVAQPKKNCLKQCLKIKFDSIIWASVAEVSIK